MENLISIIVPVYNVRPYLESCVESILRQTYQNIELILIDDGSTDESGQVCDDYAAKDRRVVVHHKVNGGVSSARNMGISTATGQYIMFVDGDDWLEENAVERMLEQILASNADACFCDRHYKDREQVCVLLAQISANRISAEKIVRKHLQGKFIASPCLSLISFQKVRDCKFDTDIHTQEDWEYNFRMLTRLDSITICHEPLYHYRTVMGSASKSELNERKMTCFLIPGKVNDFIRENELPYEKQAEHVPAYLIYHMLVILANGRYPKKVARRLCREARKYWKTIMSNQDIPVRQKIYVSMAAVTPQLFCVAYHMKYRGLKHE